MIIELKRSLYLLLSLILAAGMITGCGDEVEEDEEVDDFETTNMPFDTGKYRLTDFPDVVEFPGATLSLNEFNGNRFSWGVSGDDYQLGVQTPDADQLMCANSEQGQHIHLIVDTEPYAAYYEPDFKHEIKNGRHRVLAFLSRSYHLSLKHPEARWAGDVVVKDGEFTEVNEITEPMIFYSRPKGTYAGEDTEKILLDFYPLNVNLGTDHLIKVQVNGEVSYLDEWKPLYISNLPYGQNSVGVAIVDLEGGYIEGRQTSVLQKIELVEDPMPEN